MATKKGGKGSPSKKSSKKPTKKGGKKSREGSKPGKKGYGGEPDFATEMPIEPPPEGMRGW
jgi:hypothetical protein